MGRAVMAITLATLVAGCGHAGGGGDGTAATNACNLLPREKVAATVGKPVNAAELNAVNVSDGSASASMSSCTYTFDGGKQMSFMARWSPVDMTDAEVAQTKATLTSMGAATDVPGLGRAAFRNQSQLIVIPDARRYFSFTALSAPDGVDMPAAEMKLAKAVIG